MSLKMAKKKVHLKTFSNQPSWPLWECLAVVSNYFRENELIAHNPNRARSVTYACKQGELSSCDFKPLSACISDTIAFSFSNKPKS